MAEQRKAAPEVHVSWKGVPSVKAEDVLRSQIGRERISAAKRIMGQHAQPLVNPPTGIHRRKDAATLPDGTYWDGLVSWVVEGGSVHSHDLGAYCSYSREEFSGLPAKTLLLGPLPSPEELSESFERQYNNAVRGRKEWPDGDYQKNPIPPLDPEEESK